jgi:hypothetical protein
MLVPLYSFLRGDTLGLVVLVQDSHTIRHLAASVMRAAATRVAPGTRASVYAGERLLDPQLTVAQAGLTALDRVDVVPEES